jgi:hypothetical protein
MMGVKPEELDAFLNDDQPTRCPLCQSRTDFLAQHDKQLHWCLNDKCQLIFMAEDDNG